MFNRNQPWPYQQTQRGQIPLETVHWNLETRHGNMPQVPPAQISEIPYAYSNQPMNLHQSQTLPNTPCHPASHPPTTSYIDSRHITTYPHIKQTQHTAPSCPGTHIKLAGNPPIHCNPNPLTNPSGTQFTPEFYGYSHMQENPAIRQGTQFAHPCPPSSQYSALSSLCADRTHITPFTNPQNMHINVHRSGSELPTLTASTPTINSTSQSSKSKKKKKTKSAAPPKPSPLPNLQEELARALLPKAKEKRTASHTARTKEASNQPAQPVNSNQLTPSTHLARADKAPARKVPQLVVDLDLTSLHSIPSPPPFNFLENEDFFDHPDGSGTTEIPAIHTSVNLEATDEERPFVKVGPVPPGGYIPTSKIQAAESTDTTKPNKRVKRNQGKSVHQTANEGHSDHADDSNNNMVNKTSKNSNSSVGNSVNAGFKKKTSLRRPAIRSTTAHPLPAKDSKCASSEESKAEETPGESSESKDTPTESSESEDTPEESSHKGSEEDAKGLSVL
ncbi:hypothetical protein PCANC_28231 [Puccinia coronata f. sp. avenae]|uniref:Uncharacterized protein n=1 Tax=Puccinia coronata f. sp. avenae TaxID=200324 RepID=A0A2N5TQK8_9BASI|nr:hypothetical protein PCANC_28231 [Puccinia coronata f. sp. avenae]